MKFKDPVTWGAAVSAALLATLSMLPQAKGELVYDTANEEAAAAVVQPTPVQKAADERDSLRHALSASEKAKATTQASAQTPPVAAVEMPMAPAPVAPAAPMNVIVQAPPALAPAAPASEEVQNLSKAELLRRERVREELRNEDVLQERLEELRLRDEKRRTDQLVGAQGIAGVEPAAPAAPTAATPALKEEVIGTPVTERPGQAINPVVVPAAAPTAPAPVDMGYVVSADAGRMAPSAVSTSAVASDSDHTLFTVSPRAGLLNMVNPGGGMFNVNPRIAAGLTVDVAVADHFSIEAGYTYAECGVSLNPSAYYNTYNPGYLGYGGYGSYGTTSQSFDSQTFHENIFEIGAKIHVLGPDSRVRPFIGGGGGYSMGILNFSQQILATLPAGFSQDYRLNSFLGYLSVGADVRITKNISVGAIGKYYAVLSSTQNQNLNPVGMYGYFPGYSQTAITPYGVQSTSQVQSVGGSLANVGFYSILGDVSFTF